jgi:VIT1/CCC1 family predicted Fe2+/Mn2+ transporter
MTEKSVRSEEMHGRGREGWLRAAVLGADDGVVSVASLMIGVAASSAPNNSVLVAGVAGLVAGALSMAAGEYVSVSSQRDAEQAEIAHEREELAEDPKGELKELAGIYRRRGLDSTLAMKVAEQLSAHDRLAAHVRDELELHEATFARPVQAALVSAASFASLAVLPIAALLAVPAALRVPAMALSALVSLAVLGAVGGHVGGASIWRGAVRVAVGGSFAMGITALIGRMLRVVAA